MTISQPSKRTGALKSLKKRVSPSALLGSGESTTARTAFVTPTSMGSLKSRGRNAGVGHVHVAEPRAIKGSLYGLTLDVMSEVEKHVLVIEGVPTKDLIVLVNRFKHTDQEMVFKALGISSKTISRHADEKLNPHHSGAALALMEVTQLAEKVLGSADEAEQWISRSAHGLEGRRPIDLLTTPSGVSAVKDLLNRIDYGVYA
jgi:putative toxin-antitoxin system antitoxin component (TIGR02293 family)